MPTTAHSESTRPPAPPTGRPARSRNLAAGLAAVLIIAGGVGLEYPRWMASFTKSRVFFSGPDDYLRVFRARKIVEGESSLVRHLPEINWPHGAELHWTAPMDYVIAGAAWLVGPAVQHPDPVGRVAACVPIVLGAAYLACMIGFIRRGFGWTPALLAGLVIAVTPPFHRAFMLGHADHQCLLELLFALGIGGLVPGRRDDGRPGTPVLSGAIVSGLATGVAIWVATQGLFVWFAILAGLSAGCLWGPPRSRSRWTTTRFIWSMAVAFMVVLGFLIENWPDLDRVAIDKISTIHLALVGMAFLAPGARFAAVSELTSRRPADRSMPNAPTRREQSRTTLNVALLAAVAAFIVWMNHYRATAFQHISTPEFLRWSERVAELQPLYTAVAGDWSLERLHAYLGFAPYALPFVLMFFIRSRKVPIPMKLTCGLLAPAVTLLTIRQLRWMDHYNIAVVPVLVIGVCQMLERIPRIGLGKKPVALFVWAGVALAALLAPALGYVRQQSVASALAARAYLARDDFVAQKIVEYENLHAASTGDRRAILSDDADGPVLLYYTGLPVVSTAHHRAIDGLIEAAAFFIDTDPDSARAQLDRLGVRYVVVPPHATEQLMSYERIALGELRSFDPPTQTIDEHGRLRQTLHYRDAVRRTMLYRLQIEPALFPDAVPPPVIPGVELIVRIREDPTQPDRLTGLLYVVHELPENAVPGPARPAP